MHVYDQMVSTIGKRGLFDPDCALLLMVSGGSDSTALAKLMARMRDEGFKGPIDMLHLNHKLRGKDSDDDAAFVAQLAGELSIPLFNCEIDIAGEAIRSGANIEALARQERYAAANEALVSMCEHEGYPLSSARIVVAHTADDRIENFYMRSIVGTGPGGFRGMLYRNGQVVRPLLDCTRDGLRRYLKDEGMGWREDATNAHTDRFRAYVRNKVVPLAKEWNSNLASTLPRTMDLIADEDDMLEEMGLSIIENDVVALSEGASIDPETPASGYLLLPSFGDHARPLQRRAIHRLLKSMIGLDERIDASAVESVCDGFADGRPKSGYVMNIQGDIAVSANKKGVRIEPMAHFRARRKK